MQTEISRPGQSQNLWSRATICKAAGLTLVSRESFYGGSFERWLNVGSAIILNLSCYGYSESFHLQPKRAGETTLYV